MFKRPAILQGVIRKLGTGEGNVYITISHDSEGNPREVFATRGKGGTCDAAFIDALTRMVSVSLQFGLPPETVVAQLKGINCHPVYYEGRLVGSVADAISIALQEDLDRWDSAGKVEEVLTDDILLVTDPRTWTEEVFQKGASAIAKGVDKMLMGDPTTVETATTPIDPITTSPHGLLCPECTEMTLVVEGRCQTCKLCGYSTC